MTRSASAAALVVALLLWGASIDHARAFSDNESFPLQALQAGGAGRFFTGAPSDAYTCKVCHQGGRAPELTVSGLPLDGYSPGAAYEITVNWPAYDEHLALELEITDQRGVAAGTLRLPASSVVPVEEQCVPPFVPPMSAGVLAADAPQGRAVLSLRDCGAKRLRFLWTAPAQDQGALWFAGSAVNADSTGDATGDGVSDIRRAIPSLRSGAAVAADSKAGCSVMAVTAGSGNPCAAWLLLGGLSGWLRFRRTGRRRSWQTSGG